MEFGRDPIKDAAIRTARGFGFRDITELFDGRETLEAVDNRRDYGEVRVRATGSHFGTRGEQEGATGMVREVRMTIDWDKVNATTEHDVRRHMVEDGEDPEAEPDWSQARSVVGAASVRAKLGLSQSEFAGLIHVPVATVRNWEQGRSRPDAAAQSLLVVLWREPEAARRALAGA